MISIKTKYDKHRSGFTLLELLVAVSLISILSGIAILSFSTLQQRSRDSKRKTDLKNIASALEIFLQSNSRYPRLENTPTCSVTIGPDNFSGWCSDDIPPGFTSWIPQLDDKFMSSIPIDPQPSLGQGHPANAAVFNYAYHSCEPGRIDNCGRDFFLIARLENGRDQDLTTRFNYYNQTITLPEQLLVITRP